MIYDAQAFETKSLAAMLETFFGPSVPALHDTREVRAPPRAPSPMSRRHAATEDQVVVGTGFSPAVLGTKVTKVLIKKAKKKAGKMTVVVSPPPSPPHSDDEDEGTSPSSVTATAAELKAAADKDQEDAPDAPGARYRRFVVTWNNPNDEQAVKLLKQSYLAGRTTYVCMFVEYAPTTGTRHYQGYIELSGAQRLTTVRGWFNNLVWITQAHGTGKQCQQYSAKGKQCKEEWLALRTEGPNYGKEAQLMIELGSVRDDQGKRKDIDCAIEVARETRDLKKVAMQFPKAVVTFGGGLQRFITLMALPRSFDVPVTVEVHFGASGTGKSYAVTRALRDEFGDANLMDNAYFKSMGMGHWWDGYAGQQVVVFDEFRGAGIQFSELLKMMSPIPHMLPVKNASAQLVATRFLITSPVHPVNWYKNLQKSVDGSVDQLKRRVTAVKQYKSMAGFSLTTYDASTVSVTDVTDKNWEDYRLADEGSSSNAVFPDQFDGN